MQLPSRDPQPLKAGKYNTDFFYKKPLFEVNTTKNLLNRKKTYILNSWEEAFAIHEDVTLEDINPEYIASILFNKLDINLSPYQGIKRIPRCSSIEISSNGDINCLSKKEFFSKNSQVNEKDLILTLRNTFLNNLKNNIDNIKGNIACEHSSGIDSNSILGSLILGLNIDKNSLYTWTATNGENVALIEDIRKSYNLSPNNCINYSLNYGKFTYLDLIKIYGAPPQIGDNLHKIKILKDSKCEIIFSGLGGDQGLSNLGNNVAIDLLEKGDFNEFIQWTGSKSCAFKTFLKSNLDNNLLKKIQEFKYNFRIPKTNQLNLIKKFLSNSGNEYFKKYIPININNKSLNKLKIKEAIIESLSADWLSIRMEDEKRLANFHGIKKCFPMLDENIISYLLDINNPKIFAESYTEKRSLIRKVFQPYLNEFFIKNPNKNIGGSQIEARKKIFQSILEKSQEKIFNWHPMLHQWFNISLLRTNIKFILDQDKDFDYVNNFCWLVNKIDNINYWLIELDK